jgi:predicted Zn-dependent protease
LAVSKSPQSAQALIVGGQAAAIQTQLSYSRDMEREADRVGYSILADAGYDPAGFTGMFAKLQQSAGLNDSGAFPYLRSHPLTTERLADMQARQQLNTPTPRQPQNVAHAMLSARARVLSQSQPDALQAWTQGIENLNPSAPVAERAAALYAATLAHLQLRNVPAAQSSLQALAELLRRLPSRTDASGGSTANLSVTSTAERWLRLLQAEVAFRQDQWAQSLAVLSPLADNQNLQRPELMAMAQALNHLPGHALTPTITAQLREVVNRSPNDAQAWDSLSSLLSLQGQALASLRAAGEAQVARLDWSGALDRFRAAQELARSSRLQPGEHIEASIVDARMSVARERLRALERPER